MNSRVPVRLEWESPSGKRVKAEAHTRVVNPYGCMVVLEHDLPLEHRVALTNVPMSASNAAVIVWKSDERPEGGWNTAWSWSLRPWIFGVLNYDS